MLAVGVLLVVGFWLRADAVFGGFSDVLTVTQAAIRATLAGLNPYGVGYQESMPPGAPFAYGPLALLWYLPSLTQPGRLELLVSLGFVTVLAMRGRVLGLAIYAVLPALLVTAADGSNDTSAGLFLLVALLVAERRPLAGGFLLALAAAFKPYALAWLPPLLAYGGIAGPLLAFIVGSVIAWGPALVLWGPGPIVESLRKAEGLHAQAYYSLAWAVGFSLANEEPKPGPASSGADGRASAAGWSGRRSSAAAARGYAPARAGAESRGRAPAEPGAQPASAAFALAAILAKAAGSWTARSASTLRSSSISALRSPATNWL